MTILFWIIGIVVFLFLLLYTAASMFQTASTNGIFDILLLPFGFMVMGIYWLACLLLDNKYVHQAVDKMKARLRRKSDERWRNGK